MDKKEQVKRQWCPAHGYPLPCNKCGLRGLAPIQEQPKPEMVVCPKPCKEYPKCDHSIPHEENGACNGYCDRVTSNKSVPACIPVSQSPQSILCKCGHSVDEHYEGGGDVTYCEHKDGFYHCVCTRFVPVPPPEPVKPEGGLLILRQVYDAGHSNDLLFGEEIDKYLNAQLEAVKKILGKV